MLLNESAYRSLDALISGARKICFSGEGETLMAWRSILDLLRRPGSGRVFEIITSAFWPYDRLDRFLHSVASIVRDNRDVCNIRVSVDEFHDAKVRHDNTPALLSRFLNNNVDVPLTLGFRSITGQEEYVRRKFNQAATTLGKKPKWESEDPLRHILTIGDTEFLVEFKNVVMPGKSGISDPCALDRYIEILESRYSRPFTLGSLEYTDENPGFDITVNPNGDVVFYGMESTVIGNVNAELIDYRVISKAFGTSELCQLLYRKPFSEVLSLIRQSERLGALAEEVNNPYWIVRYANERMPGEIEKYLLEANADGAPRLN